MSNKHEIETYSKLQLGGEFFLQESFLYFHKRQENLNTKHTKDYDGRLVISSFLSIPGIEAARMGIRANPKATLRTRNTRFVSDFGKVSPKPIKGTDLEQKLCPVPCIKYTSQRLSDRFVFFFEDARFLNLAFKNNK